MAAAAGRAAAVLLAAALAAAPAAGQPAPFGSADDPREELQVVWWQHQSSLDGMGGLSLISDHWRAAGSVALNVVTQPLTARLHGTLRGGVYGGYDPDADEWYDLVRLVEFARYQRRPNDPLYVRVGLVERMRLGTGHLVNFFNTRVAWDERTVGAEGMLQNAFFDVAAFTDDVLLGGVVGGRAALRPLAAAGDARTRTFELGFNYVTDLGSGTPAAGRLTAYNADLRFNVLASGTVRLAPFTSYAWYEGYGSGLAFGATLESLNFIDLARFRLRMALYYSGREFIPGYVGSFYAVSNPRARILNAAAYLEGERVIEHEGVALADALGGQDLETELRLLIFERFEFWYYFRRHYGTQSLSEYHFRLFLRVADRLRLDAGIDRGGLKGFFSLFNDLGDQTALVFGTDYRLAGPFWLFLRSRYTFEYTGQAEDGTGYYLVQRRFEPFTGIRLGF